VHALKSIAKSEVDSCRSIATIHAGRIGLDICKQTT
jgi:hypothetical protein